MPSKLYINLNLTEENWEIIADFIVKGEIDLELINNIKFTEEDKSKNLFQTKRDFKTVLFSTFPVNLLVFILIWLSLIGIGVSIVVYLPFWVWLKTILLVFYIFILWQILTRL